MSLLPRLSDVVSPPHYVTLSRATLEAASNQRLSRQASLFEQIHYTSNCPQQQLLQGGVKYNSQPDKMDTLVAPPSQAVVPKSSTFSATKWLLESAASKPPSLTAKNGGVGTGSSIDDDDYLFPDLPPPPTAKLDPATNTPQPILKHHRQT